MKTYVCTDCNETMVYPAEPSDIRQLSCAVCNETMEEWGCQNTAPVDQYLETVLATANFDYHDPLVYAAVGLGGEAGEFQNQVQKLMRGDVPGLVKAYGIDWTELPEEKRIKLRDELGGVAWFWTLACYCLGYRPSQVMQANAAILLERKKRGTIRGNGDNR